MMTLEELKEKLRSNPRPQATYFASTDSAGRLHAGRGGEDGFHGGSFMPNPKGPKHRKFAGLNVFVENPTGSTRSGVSRKGKKWSVKMKNDYGFIKRGKGADGEGLDVFLGSDESAPNAYVIHQNDPETGRYDEDKVILGVRTPEAAKALYLSNYDTPKFYRSTTIIAMVAFKKMLTNGTAGGVHWKKKQKRPLETAAMFSTGTSNFKAGEEDDGEERWLTIGAVDHHGGTHVQVNKKTGVIDKGPPAIKGKDVDHLPPRQPEAKPRMSMADLKNKLKGDNSEKMTPGALPEYKPKPGDPIPPQLPGHPSREYKPQPGAPVPPPLPGHPSREYQPQPGAPVPPPLPGHPSREYKPQPGAPVPPPLPSKQAATPAKPGIRGAGTGLPDDYGPVTNSTTAGSGQRVSHNDDESQTPPQKPLPATVQPPTADGSSQDKPNPPVAPGAANSPFLDVATGQPIQSPAEKGQQPWHAQPGAGIPANSPPPPPVAAGTGNGGKPPWHAQPGNGIPAKMPPGAAAPLPGQQAAAPAPATPGIRGAGTGLPDDHGPVTSSTPVAVDPSTGQPTPGQPQPAPQAAPVANPMEFPHQHTLGNYVEAAKADKQAKGLPVIASEMAKTHEQSVADALKQGHHVPPEVLSEYAHLAPPHAHQQAALAEAGQPSVEQAEPNPQEGDLADRPAEGGDAQPEPGPEQPPAAEPNSVGARQNEEKPTGNAILESKTDKIPARQQVPAATEKGRPTSEQFHKKVKEIQAKNPALPRHKAYDQATTELGGTPEAPGTATPAHLHPSKTPQTSAATPSPARKPATAGGSATPSATTTVSPELKRMRDQRAKIESRRALQEQANGKQSSKPAAGQLPEGERPTDPGTPAKEVPTRPQAGVATPTVPVNPETSETLSDSGAEPWETPAPSPEVPPESATPSEPAEPSSAGYLAAKDRYLDLHEKKRNTDPSQHGPIDAQIDKESAEMRRNQVAHERRFEKPVPKFEIPPPNAGENRDDYLRRVAAAVPHPGFQNLNLDPMQNVQDSRNKASQNIGQARLDDANHKMRVDAIVKEAAQKYDEPAPAAPPQADNTKPATPIEALKQKMAENRAREAATTEQPAAPAQPDELPPPEYRRTPDAAVDDAIAEKRRAHMRAGLMRQHLPDIQKHAHETGLSARDAIRSYAKNLGKEPGMGEIAGRIMEASNHPLVVKHGWSGVDRAFSEKSAESPGGDVGRRLQGLASSIMKKAKAEGRKIKALDAIEEAKAKLGLAKIKPVDALKTQMALNRGDAPTEPAAPNYEPRQPEESDKQYAKRVIDKMPAPTSVPEDYGKYFKMEGADIVPMDRLRSTKSAEENQQGGDNGAKRMIAASHGLLGKRGPITVMPSTDPGHYDIVDGNGTYTSMSKYGWKNLPVKIVSRDEGEKLIAEDHAKEAAKSAPTASPAEVPPEKSLLGDLQPQMLIGNRISAARKANQALHDARDNHQVWNTQTKQYDPQPDAPEHKYLADNAAKANADLEELRPHAEGAGIDFDKMVEQHEGVEPRDGYGRRNPDMKKLHLPGSVPEAASPESQTTTAIPESPAPTPPAAPEGHTVRNGHAALDDIESEAAIRSRRPGKKLAGGEAKPAPLQTFKNPEDGTEVSIHKADRGGFNVVMKDTDSGEYLPSATNYPTLGQAQTKAREAANLPQDQAEPPTPIGSLKQQMAAKRSEAVNKVADSVAERLAKGEKFSFQDLYEDAQRHGMGSVADGDTNAKKIYDAMEVGVNRHILNDKEIDATSDLEGAEKSVEKLNAMMKHLPTQTWRSDEQKKFQQFSTPPQYAFAANWVANLNPNDTVLEPSAGNGGLAVYGMKAGAHVVGNEYAADRVANLKTLGVPQVHRENAEQISKIFHGKVNPTVVVMNPPFSQTAGRMGNTKNIHEASKHIDEALALLPENGRLVTIVGEGMGEDKPAYAPWFNKIKKDYNLKANIAVSGEEYGKYGTKFGTRLLVIDKNGPTSDNPVGGEASNVVDLMRKLQGVRNDRPNVQANPRDQQVAGQSGLHQEVVPGEAAGGRQPGASAPTGELGSGGIQGAGAGRTPSVRSGERTDPAIGRGNGPDDGDAGVLPGSGRAGSRTGAGGKPARPVAGGSGGIPAGRPHVSGGLAAPVAKEPHEMTQEEVGRAVRTAESQRAKKADTFPHIQSTDIKAAAAQSRHEDAVRQAAESGKIDWHSEVGRQHAKDYPEIAAQHSTHPDDIPQKEIKAEKATLQEGSTTEAATKLSNEDVAKKIAQIRKGNAIEQIPTPSGQPAPQPPIQPQPVPVRKPLNAEDGKKLSNNTYDEWTAPEGGFPYPKVHPPLSKLVESAAMAAIVAPKMTYKPSIPEEMITREDPVLRAAALESVIRAGQAHQEFLPPDKDGVAYRRASYEGGGTGFGKGRVGAGVIADHLFGAGVDPMSKNWKGKKAVWFSKNFNLTIDAERDLKDLGVNPKMLFRHDKVKMTEEDEGGTANRKKIPNADGILFSGYGTLRSKIGTHPTPGQEEAETEGDAQAVGDVSRMQQIVDWVGPDFDGPIVFDECHLMKNSVPTKGKRGTSSMSQTAIAGIELQRLLPKAKILYMSATGATEVENLGYATRLGLWGPGTQFESPSDFATSVSARGIGGMEMVSQGLKQQGLFSSKRLSYDGVKNDKLEHSLSDGQRQAYDTYCDAWSVIHDHMAEAAAATGQATDEKSARSKADQIIRGAQLRFFNQAITSMMMPSIIDGIKKDLAEGRSAVVSFVNTGEAAQERNQNAKNAKKEEGDEEEEEELSEAGPLDDVMTMVNAAYPVHQHEQYIDESGTERTRMVTDSEGNPVVNPEMLAKKQALLQKLGSLPHIDNPLDLLHEQLGKEGIKVAEATGRKRRFVYNPKTGKRDIEQSVTSLNDQKGFQDGKFRVLAMSDAAGAGASFHPHAKCKNQDQRVFYGAQTGWEADKFMQRAGRVHRTGELSQPIYRLASCPELPGQKRFVSTINRRLDQLGALSSGQRQAGSNQMFDELDNLESKYANEALGGLVTDIYANRVPEMSPTEFEKETGLHPQGKAGLKVPEMRQFLNRVLSLKIDRQHMIFNHLMDRFKSHIENAKADDTYDAGLEAVNAESIKPTGEHVIYTDPRTKAETKHVQFELKQKLKPLAFATMAKRPKTKFFRNMQSGRVWAMTEGGKKNNPKTGQDEEMYRRVGPAGESTRGMERSSDVEANGYRSRPVKASVAHWGGLTTKPGRFISDGSMVIDTEGLPPKGMLRKMSESFSGRGQSIEQSDVEKIYNQAAEGTQSKTALKEWGHVPAGGYGNHGNIVHLSEPAQEGQPEAVIGVNAEKLSALRAATEFDHLRAHSDKVVVAYKGGKPVGMIHAHPVDAEDRAKALSSGDREKKYEELSKVDAEQAWNDEVAKLPSHTTENFHLITGNPLPVWKLLPDKANIKRLQTDDGIKHLGIHVHDRDLAETLKNFGISESAPKISTNDAYGKISAGGHIILNGGKGNPEWRIKPSRVSGEQRMEIVGPALEHHPELENAGVIVSYHGYKPRYFLPTGDKGRAALDQLMKQHVLERTIEQGEDSSFSVETLTPLDQLRQQMRDLRPVDQFTAETPVKKLIRQMRLLRG